MPKLILSEITAGMGSVDLLNSNFQAVAAAMDNTVSRNGATPNQLEADLDLNGHTILNSAATDSPNSIVTVQQMQDFVSDHATGLVVQQQEIQTATVAQTVFTLNEFEYTPGSHNLAVYVAGVRKFSPLDYTEDSSTQITFLSGITLGTKVEFITNEFLGTVNLPAHTHPWTQITNVPVYTTRWPDWLEVTGKPLSFPPAAHVHSTDDITSGRLVDARRGVWVQASQPTANTVGELWFW